MPRASVLQAGFAGNKGVWFRPGSRNRASSSHSSTWQSRRWLTVSRMRSRRVCKGLLLHQLLPQLDDLPPRGILRYEPGFHIPFFSTFYHRENIACFPQWLKVDLIHQLLHQENAQATHSPVINICLQVRCDYRGWVKWFPMVTDYNSQANGRWIRRCIQYPPGFLPDKHVR